MKNLDIKKLKQIESSIVVILLLSTAIVFTTAPVQVNAQETRQELNVRIYGEENAIYPTHSYTDEMPYAWDFIYLDETMPFDPGVIAKDSITFNPIFLDHSYGIDANGDACEKVFLRAFYEPFYKHNPDLVMSNAAPEILTSVGDFNAIVTETTYHFVTLDCRQPTLGIYDNNSELFIPGEHAKMYLPCESVDDTIPGMDTASLLNIVPVRTPIPDTSADDDSNLVDGSIAIEKQFKGQRVGDTLEFLDHSFQIKAVESNDPGQDKVTFNVRYEGNPPEYDGLEDIKAQEFYILENAQGYNFYFNRDNDIRKAHTCDLMPTFIKRTASNAPAFRYYLRIDNAVVDDNPGRIEYLTITLGRELVAGETFYVNGMRYDLPAIYTTTNENGFYSFKYLTYQSPIPKGDGIIEDFSHVTSQYLTELDYEESVWVLPPYNMDDHVMIDDIGLYKESGDIGSCVTVPANGILLEDLKEALDFYYIEETIEPRFDTSLAERLNTTDEGEYWEWYNVYTKPYRYTAFVLPDQEEENELYRDDCVPGGYETADGFEYLMTTSFIGPNSEIDPNYQRDDQCKPYDEHEIYHRAFELENEYKEPSDLNYEFLPRVAYEYDAFNELDLYINEYDQGMATVRIYGEDDAWYPTHTRYGVNGCTDDFMYLDETMPFDPGVIEKDSITFNPAFLDGEVYGTYAKGDASEKIFLRAFYEPGYFHEKDCLLTSAAPEVLFPVGPFDAIVTETTYHFTTLHNRDPIAGVINESMMWLPYESQNDGIPGMDHAGLLKIVKPKIPSDCNQMDDTPDILTDGHVAVEKMFDGLQVGDSIEFMDHSLSITHFEDNDPTSDKVSLKIRYEGNPPAYDGLEDIKEQDHVVDENSFNTKFYFNRDNDMRTMSQRTCIESPAFRWYLKVDNAASSNYITLTLGRELFAGETFYVNGMRYDIPAVYTTIDQYMNDVFKFVTFQSPIPKGDGIVEDFSHVTSQYLTELDFFEPVWVLPPFERPHVMIDDVGLQKDYAGCVEIPARGILLDQIKGPLVFSYVEETIEPRFDTSIAERLHTQEDETWEWYNVYTKPNKYTEFLLPNQEMIQEPYDLDDIPAWYPYMYADGFEYLITSSWLAPNAELDTERSDLCKIPEEHEIFSKSGGGSSYNNAQLAMIIDGSGSINMSEWNLMLEGVAGSIEDPNVFPQDGSIELTVVQFASDARVEIAPVIVTSANAASIATSIRAISKSGLGSQTDMHAGITLTADTMKAAPSYDTRPRKVINLVTDGVPTDGPGGGVTPSQAAINARDYLLTTLELMTVNYGEFDSEAIGDGADVSWLRDNIVWPTPGYEAPPFTGPGWVRYVESFNEFQSAVGEKFELLFDTGFVSRFAFEFDGIDPTGLFINGETMDDVEDNPPTAVPGGPYGDELIEGETLSITFNGCGSYDNDETGSSIDQYDWHFGDGSGWHNDIGCTPSHEFSAGVYTVTLRVTDDEGDTDTDTTTVTVTDGGGEPPTPEPECNVTISVEDVNVDVEVPDSGWVRFSMDPLFTGNIAIVKFTLTWNTMVVVLSDTDLGAAWDSIIIDDTTAGQLKVTAYKFGAGFSMGQDIIKVTFDKAPTADTGDSCSLAISNAQAAEVVDESIVYIDGVCVDNGVATVGTSASSYQEGDINMDDTVDELDVYLLGTAVLFDDPLPALADGDMNDDGDIDELDVYLLGTLVMNS